MARLDRKVREARKASRGYRAPEEDPARHLPFPARKARPDRKARKEKKVSREYRD